MGAINVWDVGAHIFKNFAINVSGLTMLKLSIALSIHTSSIEIIVLC
jgi:hypothetical protein